LPITGKPDISMVVSTMTALVDWWFCHRLPNLFFGRFTFGSAPAYGSEVRAFGPGLIWHG
jgi:hypothetical protein